MHHHSENAPFGVGSGFYVTDKTHFHLMITLIQLRISESNQEVLIMQKMYLQ